MEVKWFKDGKLLTSSKGILMESRGTTRELVIEKMEKKDAGEYSCEAGHEKLVFKLHLTGTSLLKTYIEVIISCNKRSKTGIFCRCGCQVQDQACQGYSYH